MNLHAHGSLGNGCWLICESVASGKASPQQILNRLLGIRQDLPLIARLCSHLNKHVINLSNVEWAKSSDFQERDVSMISWICHWGATQYPQTDWAGTQDGSVDTSFCISLFNDIIFHFPSKENTITQSSGLERDILQQIPGLLGGRVIELQLHMTHKVWEWLHLFSFGPSLSHTKLNFRHYKTFTHIAVGFTFNYELRMFSDLPLMHRLKLHATQQIRAPVISMHFVNGRPQRCRWPTSKEVTRNCPLASFSLISDNLCVWTHIDNCPRLISLVTVVKCFKGHWGFEKCAQLFWP